jgi:hypothetical protein
MSEYLSEEWRKERLGIITASRIHRVTNGTPKGWLSFMQLLKTEIENPNLVLSSEPVRTAALEHGKETEDQCKANIELDLGVELETAEFKLHPTIPYIGATSDFLCDYKGFRWNGEIKCPIKLENHVEVLTQKRVPNKYVPQVQCQMAVHGLDRTLFASYYHDMPDPSMRLVVIEVSIDRDYQQMMLSRCEKFWDDFLEFRRNGGVLPLTPARTPQRF